MFDDHGPPSLRREASRHLTTTAPREVFVRISPSHIRNAISNPNYRIPKKSGGGPSTDAALRKAIRLFHSQGLEAAMMQIESGLSKQYWRSERGLTMAKNARQMLDTYIELAKRDPRKVTTCGTYTILALGHEINADVDLLLIDRGTHIGRLCVLSNVGEGLPAEQCALIAAAPLRGLCEQFEGQGLFDSMIAGIEVWQLRIGEAAPVSRAEASEAWPVLLTHLGRATSNL
jgi:hypothetical protein